MLGWIGSDRIASENGLNWNRFDRVGSDRIGSDWIELDWVELDCIGRQGNKRRCQTNSKQVWRRYNDYMAPLTELCPFNMLRGTYEMLRMASVGCTDEILLSPTVVVLPLVCTGTDDFCVR